MKKFILAAIVLILGNFVLGATFKQVLSKQEMEKILRNETLLGMINLSKNSPKGMLITTGTDEFYQFVVEKAGEVEVTGPRFCTK